MIGFNSKKKPNGKEGRLRGGKGERERERERVVLPKEGEKRSSLILPSYHIY